MRGLVHHLDLTVKDPWASRAFYDAVLGFMGYRLVRQDVRGFDWELTTQDGGLSSIGLMKAQGPGLARSTFDLFAIVKQIVDAKAQFRSLAEPWAATGTSTGRLMIAVLGGLADVERDLIRTRTAEGRSRAQKRGQHMGRPSKLTAARRPKHGGGGRRAYARRTRAQLRRGESTISHL